MRAILRSGFPRLYRQIEDRLSSLPGVANIGMALYSPLEGENWGECVIQQGHPAPGPNDKCGSTWDRVSPHFLRASACLIVHGRDLSDQDTQATQPVAIVNQEFVKRFYPNRDPIGNTSASIFRSIPEHLRSSEFFTISR